MFSTQGFIHPGLANIFWSLPQTESDAAVFSPYHSCNGTPTANRNHELIFTKEEDPLYFFDLAGCGVVHVCGMLLCVSMVTKIGHENISLKRWNCSLCLKFIS